MKLNISLIFDSRCVTITLAIDCQVNADLQSAVILSINLLIVNYYLLSIIIN